MNSTESYYKKWIKKISKRTTPYKIKRHIIKHSKDLFNAEKNNPLSWVASAYNLLKIYEAVHKTKSTTEVQLYKLLKKYNKNPYLHTAPPGGKIPKSVRIKRVKPNSK